MGRASAALDNVLMVSLTQELLPCSPGLGTSRRMWYSEQVTTFKVYQDHLRLDLLGPGCNWLCHLTVGMLGQVTGFLDPELSATDCAWLRLA